MVFPILSGKIPTNPTLFIQVSHVKILFGGAMVRGLFEGIPENYLYNKVWRFEKKTLSLHTKP